MREEVVMGEGRGRGQDPVPVDIEPVPRRSREHFVRFARNGEVLLHYSGKFGCALFFNSINFSKGNTVPISL